MLKPRLVSICTLIAFGMATRAATQPPQQPYAQPPQQYAPPPGYYLVPMPTQDEISALEHAGRQKRTAGIILMSSGGGLLIIGLSLWVAGVNSDDGTCVRTVHGDLVDCGNGALTGAGVGTALLGSAAVLTGLPVYFMGNAQLHRALRLRRGYALAPSIKAPPTGAGAVAAVALRF